MIATRGLALGIALVAVIFLIVPTVLLVRELNRSTFEPLHTPSPQRVENHEVRAGDVLVVHAEKCNHTDEPVAIESLAIFRNLDNRDAVPYREGFGARDPGCTKLRYENQIPPDLPPGNWRVEGIDIARRGEDVQQEPWYTEPFEVTGGE